MLTRLIEEIILSVVYPYLDLQELVVLSGVCKYTNLLFQNKLQDCPEWKKEIVIRNISYVLTHKDIQNAKMWIPSITALNDTTVCRPIRLLGEQKRKLVEEKCWANQKLSVSVQYTEEDVLETYFIDLAKSKVITTVKRIPRQHEVVKESKFDVWLKQQNNKNFVDR